MEQSSTDRHTILSHFQGNGSSAALDELLTRYPEALCLASPPPVLDAQADEAHFQVSLVRASDLVNHELNTWLDARKRSRDPDDEGSLDSSPPPTAADNVPSHRTSSTPVFQGDTQQLA